MLSDLAGDLGDRDADLVGAAVREATFEPTPDAISAARRFVTDLVSVACSADEVERLALVTSELATNAVLHAGSAFTVQVLTATESIWVAVHDSDVHPPSRRSTAVDGVSGRGLSIVEKLALDWGVHVEPTSSGKWVWAQLPLRPTADQNGADQNGAEDRSPIDLRGSAGPGSNDSPSAGDCSEGS